MSDTRLLPPSEGVNGELRSRVQAIRLDSQLGAAKASRGGAGWLGWALAGLLMLTWAGVGIRSYRQNGLVLPATASAPAPADARPADGSAAPTPGGSAPAPAAPQVEVKGYLVPARLLTVSPIDVGGRVIELNVVEGRRYDEGAVLAVLDSVSFKANYDEAVASLAGAKQKLAAAEAKLAGLLPASVRKVEVAQVEAQLAESKAQRDRAADVAARLLRLPGTSPQEQVQARNDQLAADARVAKLEADLTLLKEGPRKETVRAAEADVQAARAEVVAGEARLTQARWRLDNCVIKAPITGTVLEKKAEKGNLVNPQAFSGGAVVCTMADLAGLEVELKVPEKDISRLTVGQPCRIRSDAFPDRAYTGVLDRIMPTANRADSTVFVRVRVELPANEPPGTYLKPEMGAVVSFLAPGK